MRDYNLLEGEIGWDINLSDVQNKSKFVINSYGGEILAGFAMYDYLSLVEGSEVGVMGVCASSATIVLLGAKNRWATKNSKFLIHNPWTATVGDSNQLQHTAAELKELQDRLVGIYAKHLNGTEEFIRDLMLEERFITADEALDLGLIQSIREEKSDRVPEGKTAKAMFYNLKREKMSTISKEELSNELNKFENTFLAKIKNLFVKAKNLMMKDTDGNELELSVDTEEEIAVGITATVDGAPAEGEYVMPDGKTLKFEAGTLTEIMEPQPNQPTVEELQAKIAELEAQNSAMVAENETKANEIKAEYETKLNAVKAEFDSFKNKFSGKVNNLNIPEKNKTNNGVRKAFKNR